MAFSTSFVAAYVNILGNANYVVETDVGVLYLVHVDSNSDAVFTKSTDSGKTWAAGTVLKTGTVQQISVWFDKWSGLAGGLIHCAYTDNASSDVFYRSINTASADALSAETTVFAGASSTTGPCIAITRTRGGNILCCGTIDNGTENFAKKSTDVGGTWGDITAVMESGAGDLILLAPGFAADNQDAICIFWDASADEISSKLFDDSLNSWAETSIATAMVEGASGVLDYSIAVDLTSSYVIMTAWSAADLLNADLRIWTVSEAAITEKTNVVLNSVDDQILCGVSLDTTNTDVYVIYAGASSGSETSGTSLNFYYKLSTDDMVTWGGETRLSAGPVSVLAMFTNPRMVYLSAELVATVATNTVGNLMFTSVVPTLPTAAQVQSGVTYGINGVQFTGTFAGGGTNSVKIVGTGGLAG